ncbi:MAG: hypothetical protein LDL56_00560 [Armatimonadetes bacterium]|nr:hypothetical protein [Armatimonadota bacterium]MCA1995701.1 hypothetical protein [Armatimonadota bacterium]
MRTIRALQAIAARIRSAHALSVWIMEEEREPAWRYPAYFLHALTDVDSRIERFVERRVFPLFGIKDNGPL